MEAGLRDERAQRGEAGDRRGPAEAPPGALLRRPPGASRARAPRPGTSRRPADRTPGRPRPAGGHRRARRRRARRAPRRAGSAAGPRAGPAPPAGGARSGSAASATRRCAGPASIRSRSSTPPSTANRPSSSQNPGSPNRRAAPPSPPASPGLHPLGHRRRTPPRAAPAPRRLRAPGCAASRRTAPRSTATSGASGSSNVTVRPSPPARTNRNWSPPGVSWPAIASASGVRKCRSTARFNGRAPRSGVKPCDSRNSSAESSNSTAHWRDRSPRRARTRLELRRQDLAHHRSRQRPEDDDAIDPVQELAPERLRHGLLDAAGREARSRARTRCPIRSGSSRPGSRS